MANNKLKKGQYFHLGNGCDNDWFLLRALKPFKMPRSDKFDNTFDLLCHLLDNKFAEEIDTEFIDVFDMDWGWEDEKST